MKKIVLFILIVVLIYALGGLVYFKLNKKKPEVIKVSNLENIKGYSYSLKSNASSLYKEEFNVLKSNLESDNVNDEEYAKSIAKLFIIDLYSLNNHMNKYDVGGSEFVHPDYVSNYKLNVQDTLYKYMEDNSYGKREQELPEVASIEVKENEKTNYKIQDNSLEGYKITLKWTYTKDLEYETSGDVILVKIDKYYYVVEKN